MPPSLLDLPDLCLLAVMRHCADDPTTLCSAARTHSRLHQAADSALTSITCRFTQSHQQQLESIGWYLDKPHRQDHVTSLNLSGDEHGTHSFPFSFNILPLGSVQLNYLHLKPQKFPEWFETNHASSEAQRMMLAHRQALIEASREPSHELKKLRLCGCRLDPKHLQDFIDALLLLPSLEHLSFDHVLTGGRFLPPGLPLLESGVLQQLQQLTYLELVGLQDYNSRYDMPSLQALTRLVDLRLQFTTGCKISVDVLASCSQLMRLQLSRAEFEPGALAGKTLLQHLALISCKLFPYGASGVAELLSQLRHLQQLTVLNLESSMCAVDYALTPVQAFRALTASSKLQHLCLSKCLLPVAAGVWQHMLSDETKLPHLQSLDITGVRQPFVFKAEAAVAPECSRIARCCPHLRSFKMQGLVFSAGRLANLTSLTTLHTLHLGNRFVNGRAFGSEEALQGLEVTSTVVCQLTGLRQLEIRTPRNKEGMLLLRLTGLQQLTRLTYAGAVDEFRQCIVIFKQVSAADWAYVLLSMTCALLHGTCGA